MEKLSLEISSAGYREIISHLLPGDNWDEQAVFSYAETEDNKSGLIIKIVEWELIKTNDFTKHSNFYLELSDEKRAQIIKRAHDLKTSLVEWHSHPFLWPATFSFSDLSGLSEFVPQVMWRLKGRPYAAIVVTPFDFDALVWLDSLKSPFQLSFMKVGFQKFFPTGLTLKNKRNSYAREI